MEQKIERRGGARPGAGRPRKLPSAVLASSVPPAPPTVAATPSPPVAPKKKAEQTAAAKPPPLPRGGTSKEPPVLEAIPDGMEPMRFLELVMLGRIDATSSQVSAAKGLMAYKHKKAEEEGKKKAALQKARATQAAPRFGAPIPPGRPALKVA